MSDTAPEPIEEKSPVNPEATQFLLGIFADLYRQEVAAEEDVHRTLPFFGTALGLVIASLAYAANRMPKASLVFTSGWLDIAITGFATVSLIWAVTEAVLVLFFISRAIARRDYQRVGPEPGLKARMEDFDAFYRSFDWADEARDKAVLLEMRETVLSSFQTITPSNREMNLRRYHFRALAASHLVRSLILALLATTFIFVSDKLGYLP
jgi:hypothetical protein